MAQWNESDHPRDDEGKFTFKGGGSTNKAQEQSKGDESQIEEVENYLDENFEYKKGDGSTSEFEEPLKGSVSQTERSADILYKNSKEEAKEESMKQQYRDLLLDILGASATSADILFGSISKLEKKIKDIGKGDKLDDLVNYRKDNIKLEDKADNLTSITKNNKNSKDDKNDFDGALNVSNFKPLGFDNTLKPKEIKKRIKDDILTKTTNGLYKTEQKEHNLKNNYEEFFKKDIESSLSDDIKNNHKVSYQKEHLSKEQQKMQLAYRHELLQKLGDNATSADVFYGTIDKLEKKLKDIEISKIPDSVIEEFDSSKKWIKPVNYIRATSPYGRRRHPIYKDKIIFHKGVDLAANANTPVIAPMDGVVVSARWEGGYGNCVRIKHKLDNGKEATTVYAHLNSYTTKNGRTLKAGQKIKQGEQIGKVGSTGTNRNGKSSSTGNHLHFEVIYNGKPVDPFNYISK